MFDCQTIAHAPLYSRIWASEWQMKVVNRVLSHSMLEPPLGASHLLFCQKSPRLVSPDLSSFHIPVFCGSYKHMPAASGCILVVSSRYPGAKLRKGYTPTIKTYRNLHTCIANPVVKYPTQRPTQSRMSLSEHKIKSVEGKKLLRFLVVCTGETDRRFYSLIICDGRHTRVRTIPPKGHRLFFIRVCVCAREGVKSVAYALSVSTCICMILYVVGRIYKDGGWIQKVYINTRASGANHCIHSIEHLTYKPQQLYVFYIIVSTKSTAKHQPNTPLTVT